MSGGLVRRYAEERERWVRSAAALRAQVVDSLLSGESVDVEASSRRLGYELARDHQAFVVWSDEWADGGEQVLAMLERAALEIVRSLGARAAPRRAGPAVPRRLGRLARRAGAQRGTNSPRPPGFPRRVRRLRFTRARGPGLLPQPSRSYACATSCAIDASSSRVGHTYDDVALASLASTDVVHAKQFVARELGRLAADDDHSRRLTATLRVYLEENMSPLRAAQRLGVHENTITNRIRAAQELLPHPIERRSPELQVALRLLRLAQEG